MVPIHPPNIWNLNFQLRDPLLVKQVVLRLKQLGFVDHNELASMLGLPPDLLYDELLLINDIAYRQVCNPFGYRFLTYLDLVQNGITGDADKPEAENLVLSTVLAIHLGVPGILDYFQAFCLAARGYDREETANLQQSYLQNLLTRREFPFSLRGTRPVVIADRADLLRNLRGFALGHVGWFPEPAPPKPLRRYGCA